MVLSATAPVSARLFELLSGPIGHLATELTLIRLVNQSIIMDMHAWCSDLSEFVASSLA